MKKPLAHQLYQCIRPFIYDLGIIRALRRLFPKSMRERGAVALGLRGFDPGSAPGILRFQARQVRQVGMVADGINLLGDLRADIGLSEQTRLLLSAMQTVNISVSHVELPYNFSSRTNPVPTNLLSGIRHNITLVDVNFAQFREALIEAPRSAIVGKYVIANWAFELLHFPEQWHSNFKLMHEVWVSTSYIQNAISLASSAPVVRMPFPIECRASTTASRARFGLPDDRFIFLFSFSPTSTAARKNPFAVIESFRRAFGDSHSAKALLVIKAHHMELPDADGLREPLYSAVESVGGIVIDQNLTRQNMTDLLSVADCYVSLHRAEGFGLGMAEAMALNKPVIATAYSGNMDYMTPANSYGVRWSLRPITDEDHRWQPQLIHLYPPGDLWAEADIDHAAALMTHVYENPEEARTVGFQAGIDMYTHYSRKVIGARIAQRLQFVVAQTN